MEPFVRVQGIAALLPIDNVDTDAMIPSRETQSVARTGYGEKLFANWRYTPGTRVVNPDFVLNKPPFDKSTILVSGNNFGCGSSREAAVWSLVQFGIRSVVAGSFGDIFRINAVRNGLLTVALDKHDLAIVTESISGSPDESTLTVDLEAQTVTTRSGESFEFSIAPRDREMLLTGADEISMTLRRRNEIEAFRENDRAQRPWVYQSPWKSK